MPHKSFPLPRAPCKTTRRRHHASPRGISPHGVRTTSPSPNYRSRTPFYSLLATHSPSNTKQTAYSLYLTNNNNVLYFPCLIGTGSFRAPRKLMRPRRAVLQIPSKSSVPPRLPLCNNCRAVTLSELTLPQVLIPLYFNSPRMNTYKKQGRGTLSVAPKFRNSSLPANHRCARTPTRATLLSSFTCAHLSSHPGWGGHSTQLSIFRVMRRWPDGHRLSAAAYFARRSFQRSQASARAFLLGSVASGASPARMKP